MGWHYEERLGARPEESSGQTLHGSGLSFFFLVFARLRHLLTTILLLFSLPFHYCLFQVQCKRLAHMVAKEVRKRAAKHLRGARDVPLRARRLVKEMQIRWRRCVALISCHPLSAVLFLCARAHVHVKSTLESHSFACVRSPLSLSLVEDFMNIFFERASLCAMRSHPVSCLVL